MPIDPAAPPQPGVEANIAERLASLERQLRTLQVFLNGGAAGQLPVVAANPAFGRKGRVIYNSSNGIVYVDSGSAWVPLN